MADMRAVARIRFRPRARLACMAALLGLSLLGCGGGGGGGDGGGGSGSDSGGQTGAKRSWTYMVYMGGDNNLSSAGLMDLNEMESVGSDSSMSIVLQAEFSTKFTDFGAIGHPDYQGQTLRFEVQKDGNAGNVNLKAGSSIGNVDMGSPGALRDFILWAKTNYPADHYALVIWDHGAGWKDRARRSARRGAVQDETSGSFMSLPQLAQAVREAGLKLDLIDFDACLMAMYEVAYEFRGLADYLVFSEEVEPGDGDPYDTILADLKASPSMTGKALATTIVNRYHGFYSGPGGRPDQAVTKSAVDMSRLDALHSQIVGLSNALVSEFGTVAGVVAGAQKNSQRYEYPENHDLYDFASYLDANLTSGSTKAAAQAVRVAVQNAVVANQGFGEKVKGSHGLAIYAPDRNQVSTDQARNDLRAYGQLSCNAVRAGTWLDAVNKMTENVVDNVLVPGGFAFYAEWDTDADVDLYVWEPVELYAAWMGQTTPNGFFSGDSSATGFPEEYYVANDYVEAGDYDVILNYFEDGTSAFANVTLWYIDPANGVTDWTKLTDTPVQLDLSAPYAGDFNDLASLEDLNAYSDWWYPGTITKSASRYEAVRLNAGARTVHFRFHRKKTKPELTLIPR